MKTPIFIKFVLPFIIWYGLLILFTLLFDYFLHHYQLIFIGRYLGIAGTVLILLSFLYSLRKRKYIENGAPKQFLLFHEYIAWLGAMLILVHAGIHFNALLPWLATASLLVVVALGLTGKFLLKKSSDNLKEKLQDLIVSGYNAKDAEKKLFFDSIVVDAMKQWRAIHLPVSLLFGLLSLIHILSVLYFS